MHTEDKTYNGWSNYETWAVSLWLNNDYGSYIMVREMADDAKREQERDGVRIAPSILADAIKSMVEEFKPDLGATMYSDLLGAALSEVDWYEIAGNILSE